MGENNTQQMDELETPGNALGERENADSHYKRKLLAQIADGKNRKLSKPLLLRPRFLYA